ncbi:MAG: dihydropteroate synthase [Phycisphaerae bacterium]|nr:dihydropteroate synthase [Phycisphaerae bacterium]
MIIIGERINATRKPIAAALEARDSQAIFRTAREQLQAGAHYLDINGGDPRPAREAENIAWLVETVQGSVDVPLCIDSANPQAVKRGLSLAKHRAILNSISLESSRLGPLMPILEQSDCMVIGLLMSDQGAPAGVDDRLRNAEQLIKKLTAAGRKPEDIIIDPCFLTLSVDCLSARAVIDAIAAIHKEWPKVHIGGGCSNVSFGLPRRRYINFALLAGAIYHGMDTALIDPCTPGIMATLYAAQAVAGKDEFCMNYVTAEREGKLV